MGVKLVDIYLEPCFPRLDLLLPCLSGWIPQGVVKISKPSIVQHGGNVEIDEAERVNVRQLHAGPVVAVQLRGTPLLGSGEALCGCVVLPAYVSCYAKVGEIDPASIEQNVGGLDVEMPDAVGVAMRHGTGSTSYYMAQKL